VASNGAAAGTVVSYSPAADEQASASGAAGRVVCGGGAADGAASSNAVRVPERGTIQAAMDACRRVGGYEAATAAAARPSNSLMRDGASAQPPERRATTSTDTVAATAAADGHGRFRDPAVAAAVAAAVDADNARQLKSTGRTGPTQGSAPPPSLSHSDSSRCAAALLMSDDTVTVPLRVRRQAGVSPPPSSSDKPPPPSTHAAPTTRGARAMQTKRVRVENEESQVQDMMRRAVDAMKSGDNTPPKSTNSPAQAVAHAVVASDDDDILPSGIGPSSSLLLHLAHLCGGNHLTGVTRPPGMSRGRVVNSHATPP